MTNEDGTTQKRRRIIRMYMRQHGFCWVCGHPMLLPVENNPPTRWTATIDHLSPVDHFSPKQPRLALAAHKLCNNTRHHQEIEELDEWLALVNQWFGNPNWFKRHIGNNWVWQTVDREIK